jgi:hypothetical protein
MGECEGIFSFWNAIGSNSGGLASGDYFMITYCLWRMQLEDIHPEDAFVLYGAEIGNRIFLGIHSGNEESDNFLGSVKRADARESGAQ